MNRFLKFFLSDDSSVKTTTLRLYDKKYINISICSYKRPTSFITAVELYYTPKINNGVFEIIILSLLSLVKCTPCSSFILVRFNDGLLFFLNIFLTYSNMFTGGTSSARFCKYLNQEKIDTYRSG